MKNPNRWLAIVLPLLVAGCRTDVPPGLMESTEALKKTTGAWVVVQTDVVSLQGELLAVEPDTLFLIRNDTLCAMGKTSVRKATAFLQKYPMSGNSIAGWTLGGILLSATNGLYAIFVAPAWLIVGLATAGVTASQADKGDCQYPGQTWEKLRTYARFPQGLPLGISRDQLQGGRSGVADKPGWL